MDHENLIDKKKIRFLKSREIFTKVETNKRKLQRLILKIRTRAKKKKKLHGNLRFDALLEDGGKNIYAGPFGNCASNL